jgi:hypothetical protein
MNYFWVIFRRKGSQNIGFPLCSLSQGTVFIRIHYLMFEMTNCEKRKTCFHVYGETSSEDTTRFILPRSGTRKLTYHRPTSMAYQTTCNENLTVAMFPLALRKQWEWETQTYFNQPLGASYCVRVFSEAKNCGWRHLPHKNKWVTITDVLTTNILWHVDTLLGKLGKHISAATKTQTTIE